MISRIGVLTDVFVVWGLHRIGLNYFALPTGRDSEGLWRVSWRNRKLRTLRRISVFIAADGSLCCFSFRFRPRSRT